MRYNRHSHLANRHSFLSPSQYHWLGYSLDKLDERFTTAQAARRGTELHLFAHEAIRLGIRLPDDHTTLSMYVNDGIDMRMEIEQPLYYSDNCFGHADNFKFDSEEGILRVHDLKTGVTPASPKQLEIYGALFCLEYVVSPHEIDFEFRIYQSDQVASYQPYPETIVHIMDKIVMFDQRIEELKEAGTW